LSQRCMCMYVLNHDEITTCCHVKTPLHARAPSTRVLLFEFKSTQTEASLVVVDSLVGLFEVSVHIAADRRISENSVLRATDRGWSHCWKLLPLYSNLLTVSFPLLPGKLKRHAQPEREKCIRVYVRERERERGKTPIARPSRS